MVACDARRLRSQSFRVVGVELGEIVSKASGQGGSIGPVPQDGSGSVHTSLVEALHNNSSAFADGIGARADPSRVKRASLERQLPG